MLRVVFHAPKVRCCVGCVIYSRLPFAERDFNNAVYLGRIVTGLTVRYLAAVFLAPASPSPEVREASA